MTRAARDTGWIKSSRSGTANPNCVEIRLTETSAAVRDSKSPATGQFSLPATGWATFLTNTRSGRFDLAG